MQRGQVLLRRPANHRGDHRRDAPNWRESPRRSAARADRCALARRVACREALALSEQDLDPRRGSLLVRNGKGGRRREIGMHAWGFEQLQPPVNGCQAGLEPDCAVPLRAPASPGRISEFVFNSRRGESRADAARLSPVDAAARDATAPGERGGQARTLVVGR